MNGAAPLELAPAPAPATSLPVPVPVPPPTPHHGAGRVVHLVGRLAVDGTRQLLWPTVLALVDSGVPQCVALMHADDTEEARLMLPRSVRIVTVPGRRGWSGRRHPDPAELRAVLRDLPLLALHLHGGPVLHAGLRMLAAIGTPAPVFIHDGALAHGSWLRRLRAWARPPRLDGRQAFLVQPGRVDPVRSLRHLPEDLLTRTLGDELFALARDEAPDPLIITRGRPDDVDFARRYAQLAVLLAGAHARMTFGWIGEASPAVLAVLKAAQVELLPVAGPDDRAQVLRQAWVYLAPLGDDDDARGIVEAMSAALPCVALDRPACANLMVDELSGFLCREAPDVLRTLARLVDGAALRQAMGQAARLRAVQRYGRDRFRASLLVAHGLTLPDAVA